MFMRIISLVLRVCGVLALILGLLFWAGYANNLVPIHMLLGLLVVLSLWGIAIDQALSKGNWRNATGAFVTGVVVLLIGITQRSILPGSLHWLIQAIHLVLGLLALAVGESVGKAKRIGA